MRRYDETIDVRSGRIGEGIRGLDGELLAAHPEGPAQFVWRNRLWRVLGVQARWIESDAWWNGPAARAVRGDDAVAETDTGGDVLCEHEVWRVEAANGRDGSRGVYELAHAWSDGSWSLRVVND